VPGSEVKLKSSDLLLTALLAAGILTSSCRPAETVDRSAIATAPMANVTCNELSLYLDPALGSGYACELVPESSSSDIPMEVFIYPDHTEVTIRDYPLTRTQSPPRVVVYPVDRFSELLPDTLPRRVSDLERLISSGSLSNQELPFLPPLPMQQSFFSHLTMISFHGGKGVRFITDYNEAKHPISNRTVFYTFQGLTDDGKYWVAVTLPISSPILPENVSFPPPPDGKTIEAWFQNYSSYISEMRDELEGQSPESFSPTINILDRLVESITVG
jgi:hypothetical protein